MRHDDIILGESGLSVELIRMVSDAYEVGSKSVAIRDNDFEDRPGMIGGYDEGLVLLVRNQSHKDEILEDFSSDAWKMRWAFNDGSENGNAVGLSKFISKESTGSDEKIIVKSYSTMAFLIGVGSECALSKGRRLQRVQIQYDDGVRRFGGSLDYEKELSTMTIWRRDVDLRKINEVDI